MAKECRIQKNIADYCNCTYKPCSRKGLCCECVAYHRRSGELPACYFDSESEASYDRSAVNYLSQKNTTITR